MKININMKRTFKIITIGVLVLSTATSSGAKGVPSKDLDYGPNVAIGNSVDGLKRISIEGSIEIPEKEPVEKPAEKPENKPTEKPEDKPTDKPVEKPVEKPEINKVRNKETLTNVLLEGIRQRKELIEVDYYGEDITTNQEVNDIIIPLHRTGEYKIANLSRWGTLNSKRDGYRRFELHLEYRTTEQEESFVESEVKRISQNIINSGMSDHEKVQVIHDYLVNNIEYSDNTVGHSGSAHTLFKEGKGVCNAYALSMSKLFDYNNIENKYIVGDARHGEGDPWVLHAWNKVKVDGEWYNIDATWNYPKSEYGLHNAYYYFLVSDGRFQNTHKPHYSYLLPSATNSQYDGMYDNNFSKN